jgi:ketosteroid isomerase-like protein
MVTDVESESSPTAVLERLQWAINQHDLDALAACFDPDYHSEFPVHPDRTFRGHEQMRKNWTQIFGAVPDIEATLLRCTSEGDTVCMGRMGMDWHARRWRSVRYARRDDPGSAAGSDRVGAAVYGTGARGRCRC